jgi:chorismate-pyruvate lyase
VPGVIAGSVIRVELLPGPRVFDLVVAAVLVPLGNWLATTRRISAGDSGRPVRPILAPCHLS